jgi:hypothetical protein
VTGNDDARLDLLSSLVPSDTSSAGSIILSGLLDLPATPSTPFDPYRPLFACLLLAHLLRSSEHAKKIAREITLSPPGGDDDEDKVGLIQLIIGNLMMASREQTEAVNRSAKDGTRPEGAEGMDEEDWTRVMVGYLVLLCTWLWDSPRSVREFLAESANLQIVSPFRGMSTDLTAHTAYHADYGHGSARAGTERLFAGRVLRVQ